MITCGIHSGSKFGKFTSSKDLVSWGSASSMASFTQSFHFGSFRLHFLKFAAGTGYFLEIFRSFLGDLRSFVQEMTPTRANRKTCVRRMVKKKINKNQMLIPFYRVVYSFIIQKLVFNNVRVQGRIILVFSQICL
jgi:hypothetical protein